MGGQGRSYGSQVLVFVAAAVYLGWGVWDVPLASGYTDPVRKVRPQDLPCPPMPVFRPSCYELS